MERTYFIIKANTIKYFIKGINGRKNTSSILSPWFFFSLQYQDYLSLHSSVQISYFVFKHGCISNGRQQSMHVGNEPVCKNGLVRYLCIQWQIFLAKLRELAMDSLLQTYRDVRAPFQYIQLLFKVINWVKSLLTIPANSCQTTMCTLTCDLPWLCLLGYDSTYHLLPIMVPIGLRIKKCRIQPHLHEDIALDWLKRFSFWKWN